MEKAKIMPSASVELAELSMARLGFPVLVFLAFGFIGGILAAIAFNVVFVLSGPNAINQLALLIASRSARSRERRIHASTLRPGDRDIEPQTRSFKLMRRALLSPSSRIRRKQVQITNNELTARGFGRVFSRKEISGENTYPTV